MIPRCAVVSAILWTFVQGPNRERIGLLGPTLTIDAARRRAAIMLANVAIGEGDGSTTSATTAGTRAPVNRWNALHASLSKTPTAVNSVLAARYSSLTSRAISWLSSRSLRVLLGVREYSSPSSGNSSDGNPRCRRRSDHMSRRRRDGFRYTDRPEIRWLAVHGSGMEHDEVASKPQCAVVGDVLCERSRPASDQAFKGGIDVRGLAEA